MLDEASSDVELLSRAAQGDRAAFAPIVFRHEASLVRFVLRMGSTQAEAEDVVQEAFLSAYQAAPRFRGEGSVRGWLFSIATNAWRQSVRRNDARLAAPESPESLERLGVEAGWGAEPSADFEARLAERDALERAIEQLAEDERDVLILRDVEGLTGDETAEALGLTLAAMKSRLHRARLRLAGLLREGGRDGR